MRICDLPAQILIDIFLFLSPIEIIRLERCMKYIKDIIMTNIQIFQKHLNTYYSLESSPRQILWKRIVKRLILSPNACNAFLPYYTDGGTRADISKYFIDKLVLPLGMHSSVKKENVLIKYAYRGREYFNYSRPSHYKVEENVFYIPDIEDFPWKVKKKIPFVEKIVISLPDRDCFPLSLVAFFACIDKTDPTPIVNIFKGCNSKHKAVSKGEKLGLICSYKKSKFSTAVFYKKSFDMVKPLCWVKIKNDGIIKPENLTVRLPQGVFARYFYVLMIGSDYYSPEASIDANYISPICKEITLIS